MKFGLTSDLHYGFTHNTHSKLTRFFRNLAKEKLDYLIIAGDIATTCQHQIKRCLEEATMLSGSTMGVVFGNHDFWGMLHKKDSKSGSRSLKEVLNYHDDLCKKLFIDRLSQKPVQFIKDDKVVEVYGFDGWYHSANVPTNDEYNITKQVDGCPTMSYLVNKAWIDFEACLYAAMDSKADVKILVTHHNLYIEKFFPDSMMAGVIRFYPEVKDTFDILCCGHTHVFQDYMDDTLRVMNCGSDYNNPKVIIFDPLDNTRKF